MSRSHRPMALLAALAAVAALILGPVSSVTAYGDSKGPPCSDYVPSDGYGSGVDSSTGEVVIRNGVSREACPGKVDYVLHVLDASGTTEITTAAGFPADFNGIPAVGFIATIPTGIDVVCVYLTSGKGHKVSDRAPDTGCDPISGPPAGKKGYG